MYDDCKSSDGESTGSSRSGTSRNSSRGSSAGGSSSSSRSSSSRGRGTTQQQEQEQEQKDDAPRPRPPLAEEEQQRRRRRRARLRQSQDEDEMASPFRLYQEVSDGLERNSSVGWDNSVACMQLAVEHIEAPETQAFLQRHFDQIVGILLDQVAHRVDPHQRLCIEHSLGWAIMVVLLTLQRGQDTYLPTLLALFNGKKTFYKGGHAGGAMSYWNVGGAFEVRAKLLETFAREAGFQALLALLRTTPKAKGWIGAGNVFILLQGAIDARDRLHRAQATHQPAPDNNANNAAETEAAAVGMDPVIEQLCACLLQPLPSVSEDDLKKQSFEDVKDLVLLCRKRVEHRDHLTPFFVDAWLTVVLTYVRSTSLPLRLHGWEHMGALVEAGRQARPPARRYVVRGAGVDAVNGVYTFSRFRNDAPEYQYEVGDGRVLTLFRCQMRSKCRWWFLSEADEASPGTDKDIDYYQHRSLPIDDREPQLMGWSTCSSGNSKGQEPPPLVERLDPMCEPGKEEDSLEHCILRWALEHNLVEDLFGPSIHREVVSRSGVLLSFMADMKGLTQAHVERIWHASVGQAEAELVEEIHLVLAALVPYSLSAVLTMHLFTIVQQSVRDGALVEALAFVEKLDSRTPPLKMNDLLVLQGPESVDALLHLLWELLLHPGTRLHKGAKVARTLFAHAIRSIVGTERQRQFLGQCLRTVHQSAGTTAGGGGEEGEPFDEEGAINALRMTQFLLEVFPAGELAPTLHELATKHQLPDLLFQELRAFKQRQQRQQQQQQGTALAGGAATAAEAVLVERVKLRLDLLRYVHSHADTVKLDFGQLERLWEALDSPAEKQLFLLFLAEACRPPSRRNSGPAPKAAAAGGVRGGCGLVPLAFSPAVMWAAFRDIVCARADWTSLGDEAYGCFSTYFTGLRQKEEIGMDQEHGEEEQEEEKKEGELGALDASAGDDEDHARTLAVGLDALWRIALTARTQSVAEAATRDLLSVYGEQGAEDREEEEPADADAAKQKKKKEEATPVVAVATAAPADTTHTEPHPQDPQPPAAPQPQQGPLQQQQQQQQQQQDGPAPPAAAGAPETARPKRRLQRRRKESLTQRRLHFLQRVFEHLGACRDGLGPASNSSSTGEAADDLTLKAERCLRLVQGAIAMSMAGEDELHLGAGSGQSLAHGVRGQAGRQLVMVKCTNPPQQHVRGGMNIKTEPIPIYMHPLETMAVLKRRIAARCNHPVELIRLNPSRKDDQRFQTAGLADGAEVTAFLQKPILHITTTTSSSSIIQPMAQLPLQQPLPHPQPPQQQQPEAEELSSQVEPHTQPQETGDATEGPSPMVVASASGEGTAENGNSSSSSHVPPAIAPVPMGPQLSSSFSLPALAPPTPTTPSQPATIGVMIAREETYCRILFDLLECSSSSPSGNGMASVIWELLLVLPTQSHTLELVTQAAAAAAAPAPSPSSSSAEEGNGMVSPVPAGPQWSSLIAPTTWHRSVYCMQIIDALLQPSEDVASTPELWAVAPAEFREAFLRTGGFSHVLDVLMRTTGDGPQSMVQRMATAVALRIVKFYLFGEENKGPSSTSTTPRNIRMVIDAPTSPTQPPPPPPPPQRTSPTELLGGDKRVRQLLSRLVQVAAQTHDAAGGGVEGEQTWEMTVDALATIEMLLRQSPPSTTAPAVEGSTGSTGTGEMGDGAAAAAAAATGGGLNSDLVSALVMHPLAPTLLMGLLLRNPHAKVRAQTRNLIVFTHSPLLSQSVFGWCLGTLEKLEPECQTCYEFFDVLQALSKPRSSSSHAPTQQQQQNGSAGDAMSTTTVVAPTPPTGGGDDLIQALSKLVTSRLAHYPRGLAAAASPAPGTKDGESPSPAPVLLGYLRLIHVLAERDVDGTLFAGTELEDLVGKAFSEMLFAVPTLGGDHAQNRPLCPPGVTESRKLVFSTLLTRARQSPGQLKQLLDLVLALTQAGSAGLRIRWHYECSFEAKSHPGQLIGLRNQGCTCYMNSLLQNLFMVPRLRDAVLAARVKRRRTVPAFLYTDAELVGNTILVQWAESPGLKHQAVVENFFEETGEHLLKYPFHGDTDERARVKLREGRPGKETGEYEVFPAPKSCTLDQIKEMEAAQRLLEQMQRTFCYLQSSEKRFFDPLLLVEACKCLNLNYSVYQQNDAAEFCDQLLDKLEEALKGSPQLDDLNAGCFGGKFAYQKIPKGCDHRTEREEAFIKLELLIKGKESIEESLAAWSEGELMDGENQVECESCNTKKPTIRRSCLGQLPNLLILHLKRFDLDYTTFETVKLNNRCAFPTVLNVKPYTREGLEEAAALAPPDEEGGEGSQQTKKKEEEGECAAVPMVLDDGDYEYELKGVVIHAGVAQGGHYYSYIKDRQREDTWHKFDDEDVTSFDPSLIEAQCFGGSSTKTTTTFNGVVNSIEQERVHNALLLFYEKVRPRTETAAAATAPVVSEGEAAAAPASSAGKENGDAMDVGPPDTDADAETFAAAALDQEKEEEEEEEEDPFVYGLDGREAFGEEVWRANVDFIYHTYLFDHQFHTFLAGLLGLLFRPMPQALPTPGNPLSMDEAGPLWDPTSPEVASLRKDVFSTGVMFLLDVMLHSRERPSVHAWMGILRRVLGTDPQAASWLLEAMVDTPSTPAPGPGPGSNAPPTPRPAWLRSYFLDCGDCTARNCVLQLVVMAIKTLAAHAEEAQALREAPLEDACAHSRVARFFGHAMDLLNEVPQHWRNADELFALFRDAAKASEAVRVYLLRNDTVFYLAMFVLGDSAQASLRNRFPYASSAPPPPPSSPSSSTTVVPAPGRRHASSSNSNYKPNSSDLLYVFEAIATLMGVPQLPKAPLLEEPADGDGGLYTHHADVQLTPAAREAFTNIFNEHARGDGVSTQDMARYLEKCKGQQPSHYQLKNLMSQHEKTPDGRLSLVGFLAYYRHQAQWNTKSAWHDLHAMGYRNDLRPLNAAYPTSIEEIMGSPPPELPPPPPPLPLPFQQQQGATQEEDEEEGTASAEAAAMVAGVGLHGEGEGKENSQAEEEEEEEEEAGGGTQRQQPQRPPPPPPPPPPPTLQELGLPKDSRLTLSVLVFFTQMYDVLPEETRGTLQAVCRGDLVTSERLIDELLTEFVTLVERPPLSQHHQRPSSLHWGGGLEVLIYFGHALMDIPDGLMAARARRLLWNPDVGVYTKFVERCKNAMQGNNHQHKHRRMTEACAVYRSLVEPFVWEVNKRCGNRFDQYLDGGTPELRQQWDRLRGFLDFMRKWPDGSMYSRGGHGGGRGGQRSDDSEGEEEEEEEEEEDEEENEEDEDGYYTDRPTEEPPLGVKVSGAGVEEVNGLYVLRDRRLLCDGYVFQQHPAQGRCMPDGRPKVYTLYRCALETPANSWRWYISIMAPHQLDPGTAQDEDYYYVDANEPIPRYDDVPARPKPYPPSRGWRPHLKQVGGQAPTIEVLWRPLEREEEEEEFGEESSMSLEGEEENDLEDRRGLEEEEEEEEEEEDTQVVAQQLPFSGE